MTLPTSQTMPLMPRLLWFMVMEMARSICHPWRPVEGRGPAGSITQGWKSDNLSWTLSVARNREGQCRACGARTFLDRLLGVACSAHCLLMYCVEVWCCLSLPVVQVGAVRAGADLCQCHTPGHLAAA